MLYFFIGVALFGLLEIVIMPQHNHDDDDEEEEGHSHKHEEKKSLLKKTKAAAIAETRKSPRTPKKAGSKKVAKKGEDEEDEEEVASKIEGISKKDALALYRTSLITFIAMGLHNIPEGISVYLAALNNPQMGMKLAMAIMLHNGLSAHFTLFHYILTIYSYSLSPRGNHQ